jgi:hypothetical protein
MPPKHPASDYFSAVLGSFCASRSALEHPPPPSACTSYGGPFCIYPWFAFNGKAGALTYGVDYPGTRFDYGQASQFATTPLCGGPFGADSTYCDTIIKPVPLGDSR